MLHPQCLIQHTENSFVKDECIETARFGAVALDKKNERDAKMGQNNWLDVLGWGNVKAIVG